MELSRQQIIENIHLNLLYFIYYLIYTPNRVGNTFLGKVKNEEKKYKKKKNEINE